MVYFYLENFNKITYFHVDIPNEESWFSKNINRIKFLGFY